MWGWAVGGGAPAGESNDAVRPTGLNPCGCDGGEEELLKRWRKRW